MAEDLIGGSPISIAASLGDVELQRFTHRLVGLARAHLNAQLRQKVDPEDVVQSAYKSFIFRYGDAELGSNGMDALWSLLTQITLRKCADKARYFQADCRDLTREAASTANDDTQPCAVRFAKNRRRSMPQ